MNRVIKQFEIYAANLEPSKGSEQGGIRPCIILQTNGANLYATTFLIAPLTSKQIDRLHSHEVFVPKSRCNGLKQDSKIKLGQLRVIDKKRFTGKIGNLEINYQPAVFQAIDIMIDRFGDFR